MQDVMESGYYQQQDAEEYYSKLVALLIEEVRLYKLCNTLLKYLASK